MAINPQTRLFGVIGYPLGHTLSPAMHNAAFAATDINAVYLAFETKDIEACMAGMKSFGIQGLSVTIPYKSKVLPFLDEVRGVAGRIGAVNTVINENGRLIGYNTDGLGALKALEGVIQSYAGTCLIFGAGGAARAIGFVMKERGLHVTIANRSPDRGKELALFLGCPFISLQDIGDIETQLLIQATPVGMYPQYEQCLVPESFLKKEMVVMDIIYNPPQTRLLELARARGCRTIGGLAMFIQQGAEQFRLWTGLNPPLEIMANAVLEALTQISNERD